MCPIVSSDGGTLELWPELLPALTARCAPTLCLARAGGMHAMRAPARARGPP